VNVGYDSGSALFVDQVVVEGVTGCILGGGSGSLWRLTQDASPLRRNSDGSFAIANRINLVLDNYGVSVDEGTAEPPPPPAMGSIAGKVTDSTETAAVAGATVSIDSG